MEDDLTEADIELAWQRFPDFNEGDGTVSNDNNRRRFLEGIRHARAQRSIPVQRHYANVGAGVATHGPNDSNTATRT